MLGFKPVIKHITGIDLNKIKVILLGLGFIEHNPVIF